MTRHLCAFPVPALSVAVGAAAELPTRTETPIRPKTAAAVAWRRVVRRLRPIRKVLSCPRSGGADDFRPVGRKFPETFTTLLEWKSSGTPRRRVRCWEETGRYWP